LSTKPAALNCFATQQRFVKPCIRSCLLASLLPLAANAENYVVGVENAEFMPYSSIDGQGRYSGYGRELLDHLAAASAPPTLSTGYWC
jgi:ABC-type amino acid transport substrate-binding protein